MEKYYRFAGLELCVATRDEWMYDDDRMLAPFRVESVTEPHRFIFTMVDVLTPPAGELTVTMDNFLEYREGDCQVRYIGTNEDWSRGYMRAEHRGREHTVELKRSAYPGGVNAKAVLNAMEAEHLIARNRGVVFHCSYIDRDGKAILFTAPSGTGKSTQADLWHRYRNAQIINGDRAVIRLAEDQLVAEGIPFAGSSRYYQNRSLPLKAIVYLGQAPKTTVRRLKGYEAFACLWEGVSVNTWDKKDMELVSQVVEKTAQQVPVFYMPCTPDEGAVVALEQELRKLENT